LAVNGAALGGQRFDDVVAVAFSADGDELIAGTLQGSVYVYDVATIEAEMAKSGEEIARRIVGTTGLSADESGIAPIVRLRLVE